MEGLKKIYDFRQDHRIIKILQEASLSKDLRTGLKIGLLIDTDEWFKAIEHGVIPKQIVRGTISDVYMAGHNDFAEFKIQSDSGLSAWGRDGDDGAYKIGKQVALVYVNQKYKLGAISNVLLRFGWNNSSSTKYGIDDMLSRIKAAIEFLKDNQSFKLGDIRLGIDSVGRLEVAGWSQYYHLSNISRDVALKELKETKTIFSDLLDSSAELRNFVDDKEKVFTLYYDDSGKASIEICSEINGIINWKI